MNKTPQLAQPALPSKMVTVPHPSVAQVIRAKEVFAYALRMHASYPGESKRVVIANALAAVWTAGRLYQKAEGSTDNHADAIRLYDSIAIGGAGLL
ncbi:MAG TPA: hypothetical protein H9860_09785 [Candidatus Gemmiger faecavium]|nr:hypothetical protein [Candidatus Gemmiger faecavium]